MNCNKNIEYHIRLKKYISIAELSKSSRNINKKDIFFIN